MMLSVPQFMSHQATMGDGSSETKILGSGSSAKSQPQLQV
jgi:hypothetical protein